MKINGMQGRQVAKISKGRAGEKQSETMILVRWNEGTEQVWRRRSWNMQERG